MSDLFKNKYRIPPARLQTWNYADNGMYFITICTANKECFFGNVVETRNIASTDGCRGATSFESEYKMELNTLGQLAEKEWVRTIELRPDMNLEMAEFIVMPNHFHGIVLIGDNRYNTVGHDRTDKNIPEIYLGDTRAGNTIAGDAKHHVSTRRGGSSGVKNKFGPQAKNLASIIRGFKSAVTTSARTNDIQFDWQARYHDHIISTEDEYFRIANYIVNNPNSWHSDKLYK